MKMVLHPDVLHRSGRLDGQVNVYRKADGSISNLVRTFTPPSNPQSQAQMYVRNGFTTASQAWASLSSAIKTAWNNLAAASYQSLTDPQTLQTYGLTGQALYVSAAMLAIGDGASPPSAAPTDVPPGSPGIPSSVSIVQSTGVVTVVLSVASPGTSLFRLRITPAYTAGYAKPLGLLRVPWSLANRDDATLSGDPTVADLEYQAGASMVSWDEPYASLANGETIVAQVLRMSTTDYLPSTVGELNNSVTLAVS